ncbi:unnamed protein product [Rhizophagus irregularis]|nr:unnamed protein product [Rhizophagus irregularis]CAB4400942.1 unnamed protein product [Rhizophagus irregularis]CAB5370838.1 unnamed protein product [Rhizophagus irregularis]
MSSCCLFFGRIGAVKRKPDIVLVNRNHVIQKRYEEVVYWSNIHVIEEIKCTCQSNNISTDLELAGYVREIFGNQHNRRFVFGFTLCGGFMRVWLFDRSGGISLNRIDIYHDPTMFIRAITGFATMELFQLGYYTTIMDLLLRLGCIEIEKCDKQRPENKKTERFALIEMIFHRAVISGRGTICWRAYHLDEDGKEMTDKEFVIKDLWRSISRKNTEGNLLKRATNALKHISDTRIMKYYYHEDVTLIDGKTQLREPEYHIHTRLITSTCGKPIYHFNDQVELLTALYDAIEGHQNLFRIANILHGDISLYNIMIGADGQGFIIDLDYAIDLGFDQSSATDCNQKKDALCHRTGTLPFMAIEILNHNAKHTFQHDLEFFFYVLCWICSEYEGPRGKLCARDCKRKNLMKWVEGFPETISIFKSGMLLDFERNVLETFSPYFNNLKGFMVKFCKILFKASRLRVDVSYGPILKLFDDEIQQRKNKNLTNAFGNLNV